MSRPQYPCCALAALAFWLAGCSFGEPPCAGVDCSGHGVCQEAAGAAACVCDPGFEAQGLACVAIDLSGRMGQPCELNGHCISARCHRPLFGFSGGGYCTDTCGGDADCENTAADGAPMCCVAQAFGEALCLKAAPDGACGEGDVACGGDCSQGLETDCAPGLQCTGVIPGDSLGLCTRVCETDAGCADCRNAVPDRCGCDALTCLPTTEPGLNLCQPILCDCCLSSRDCGGDDVCFPAPDENGGIGGSCGRLGDLKVGTACDEQVDPNDLPSEERCAAFYCLDGRCTEVCEQDADCPGDMVCRATDLPVHDGQTIAVPLCRVQ